MACLSSRSFGCGGLRMHRYRRLLLLGSCAAAVVIGSVASSAQTVTYSYDAIGRLQASSISGGPNPDVNTMICLDQASNRERYVVAVAGAASCVPPPITPTPSPVPTPTPTPTPTPGGGPLPGGGGETPGECRLWDLWGNCVDP